MLLGFEGNSLLNWWVILLLLVKCIYFFGVWVFGLLNFKEKNSYKSSSSGHPLPE
jgi:hypothetical protein